MIRIAVLSACLLFPTIASAGWTVVFEPNLLRLSVGETARITVRAEWRSGFSFYPFPPSTFHSANVRVAIANGQYPDSSWPATIFITAVAPGRTEIVRHGDTWAVFDSTAEVFVSCAQAIPVRFAATNIRTVVGQPVLLETIIGRPDLVHFTWYKGRLGDTSHRLPTSSPNLAHTPEAAGEQYFWVSAVSGCSNTTAEARIEACASATPLSAVIRPRETPRRLRE